MASIINDLLKTPGVNLGLKGANTPAVNLGASKQTAAQAAAALAVINAAQAKVNSGSQNAGGSNTFINAQTQGGGLGSIGYGIPAYQTGSGSDTFMNVPKSGTKPTVPVKSGIKSATLGAPSAPAVPVASVLPTAQTAPAVSPQMFEAQLRGVAELAALYGGVDYDRALIEDIYNQGTDAAYAVRYADQAKAENNFADQLANSQASLLQQMRAGQGSALMSGASAGMSKANELSSVLGLSQQNVAGATGLADARGSLSRELAAQKMLDTQNALTYANDTKLALGGLSTDIYGTDAAQAKAKMDYLAALDLNKSTLEGTKYSADISYQALMQQLAAQKAAGGGSGGGGGSGKAPAGVAQSDWDKASVQEKYMAARAVGVDDAIAQQLSGWAPAPTAAKNNMSATQVTSIPKGTAGGMLGASNLVPGRTTAAVSASAATALLKALGLAK